MNKGVKILWQHKGGNGFLCPKSLEEIPCGMSSTLALENEEELSRPTGETRQAGRKKLNVQTHGLLSLLGAWLEPEG